MSAIHPGPYEDARKTNSEQSIFHSPGDASIRPSMSRSASKTSADSFRSPTW
jgi:hypothetical protein